MLSLSAVTLALFAVSGASAAPALSARNTTCAPMLNGKLTIVDQRNPSLPMRLGFTPVFAEPDHPFLQHAQTAEDQTFTLENCGSFS